MRSPLGKGLQSLIPKRQSKTIKSKDGLKDLMKLKKESVFNIEIDKIRPNPNQPRREMSEEQLKELAASIKEYGILQPILVTKVERQTDRGRDVEYELVAGERRWRAAQIAKLPRVPVIIKDNSKRVKFEMALVENLQREDLNPIEKALAYKRLNEEFGLSHIQIAEKVGKNRATVTNALRLLNLPPVVQRSISDGKLLERHGRAVLAAKPERRIQFFRNILKNGWNVEKTEEMATKLTDEERANKSTGPKNVFFKSLEHKAELALGQKVSITQRGDNNGRIVIRFADKGELNKIVDYLLKF